MFFTQDDYKKIQQWLVKNSVRDTEFNEANMPFNGEETITIVQGNQNKKVFLKDLISQVFNLGISDFVNITDKYDAPNISLEEAIRLIPSRARKEGQVITFLDREDHWHIYQFKGVLNQWNVLDTWKDLFDWEKIIIDSILPDEEDLTKSLPDENGNSYLSLKDREYNPEDFSGLGRVILRKNIVEVEDPIYDKVKKNILYQDMFTQSNTIYEIRYDFDLNGQGITIPEGCVLDFQGGSLNNGCIILSNNVTINGNNSIIRPIVKVNNNTYSCNTAIKAIGVENITINNIVLEGLYDESVGPIDVWAGASTYTEDWVYIEGCSNVIFNKMKITGFYSSKPTGEWEDIYNSNIGFFPVFIRNCNKVTLTSCSEDNSNGEAWCIFWCKDVVIDKFLCIQKYGASYLTLMYNDNLKVTNSILKRTSNELKGNLLNVFSSKYIIMNNIFEGGGIDYGNEHTNVKMKVNHYSFVTKEGIITNNHLINSSINNNTSNPISGILPEIVIENMIISNNEFILNPSYNTSIMGISSGARGNINKLKILDNNIKITNDVIQSVDVTKLRYQPIISYGQENKVFDLEIANNTLIFEYNQEHINQYKYGPVGGIYVRNIKDCKIYNNKVSDLYGIVHVRNTEDEEDSITRIIGNDASSHTPSKITNQVSSSVLCIDNNRWDWKESGQQLIYIEVCKHFNYCNNIVLANENPRIYYNANTVMIQNNCNLYASTDLNRVGTGMRQNVPRFNVAAKKYLAITFNNTSVSYFVILEQGSIQDVGILRYYSNNNATLTLLTNCTGKAYVEDLLEFYVSNSSCYIGSKSYSLGVSIVPIGSIEGTIKTNIIEDTTGLLSRKISRTSEIYTNSKPPTNVIRGFAMYNTALPKPLWHKGDDIWIDANGDDYNFKHQGLFNDKPSLPRKGFPYFCTDKQTTEGATNGIIIYHKGNNVWVDALGRVVE